MGSLDQAAIYQSQSVNWRAKFIQLSADFELQKEVVDLFDKSRAELDKHYEDQAVDYRDQIKALKKSEN